MSVTLTNLITNGSFEDTANWNGGAYSTDQAYTGSRSYKMTGTASTAEVTAPTSGTIPLTPSHIYYARIYGYQPTAVGSVGFYWPIAEPNFRDGIPVGPAGTWNLYSHRTNRASFSAGSYQFRLDFNNGYVAGTTYFDGCMLIDLTTCFGAGNEPTQAWCDANIPFFESTCTVDTFLSIMSASFSPNPVSAGSATKLSVDVREIVAVSVPQVFTWTAGQITAGGG